MEPSPTIERRTRERIAVRAVNWAVSEFGCGMESGELAIRYAILEILKIRGTVEDCALVVQDVIRHWVAMK